MPCGYVELISGSETTEEDLMKHALQKVNNKLAQPVHIEILEELPKTPVGKIFKPDLRKKAITRVFNESFKTSAIDATVSEVVDYSDKGLVAIINTEENVSDDKINEVVGEFIIPWQRSR